MTAVERLKKVKDDYKVGRIKDEQLHLHVEPYLWDSEIDEGTVLKIANGIELAVFTMVGRDKKEEVLRQIQLAIDLLSESISA